MTTAAALPDALSDSAREFVSGPHRLLIGGERLDAADGRTFETLDPATGERDRRGRARRRRGRRPRGRRGARGVRRRPWGSDARRRSARG